MHIRQLHDSLNITKRFHLDDLIFYVTRSSDYPSQVLSTSKGIGDGVEYVGGAMGDIGGAWQVGQRGYDMSDMGKGVCC